MGPSPPEANLEHMLAIQPQPNTSIHVTRRTLVVGLQVFSRGGQNRPVKKPYLTDLSESYVPGRAGFINLKTPRTELGWGVVI